MSNKSSKLTRKLKKNWENLPEINEQTLSNKTFEASLNSVYILISSNSQIQSIILKCLPEITYEEFREEVQILGKDYKNSFSDLKKMLIARILPELLNGNVNSLEIKALDEEVLNKVKESAQNTLVHNTLGNQLEELLKEKRLTKNTYDTLKSLVEENFLSEIHYKQLGKLVEGKRVLDITINEFKQFIEKHLFQFQQELINQGNSNIKYLRLLNQSTANETSQDKIVKLAELTKVTKDNNRKILLTLVELFKANTSSNNVPDESYINKLEVLCVNIGHPSQVIKLNIHLLLHYKYFEYDEIKYNDLSQTIIDFAAKHFYKLDFESQNLCLTLCLDMQKESIAFNSSQFPKCFQESIQGTNSQLPNNSKSESELKEEKFDREYNFIKEKIKSNKFDDSHVLQAVKLQREKLNYTINHNSAGKYVTANMLLSFRAEIAEILYIAGKNSECVNFLEIFNVNYPHLKDSNVVNNLYWQVMLALGNNDIIEAEKYLKRLEPFKKYYENTINELSDHFKACNQNAQLESSQDDPEEDTEAPKKNMMPQGETPEIIEQTSDESNTSNEESSSDEDSSSDNSNIDREDLQYTTQPEDTGFDQKKLHKFITEFKDAIVNFKALDEKTGNQYWKIDGKLYEYNANSNDQYAEGKVLKVENHIFSDQPFYVYIDGEELKKYHEYKLIEKKIPNALTHGLKSQEATQINCIKPLKHVVGTEITITSEDYRVYAGVTYTNGEAQLLIFNEIKTHDELDKLPKSDSINDVGPIPTEAYNPNILPTSHEEWVELYLKNNLTEQNNEAPLQNSSICKTELGGASSIVYEDPGPD